MHVFCHWIPLLALFFISDVNWNCFILIQTKVVIVPIPIIVVIFSSIISITSFGYQFVLFIYWFYSKRFTIRRFDLNRKKIAENALGQFSATFFKSRHTYKTC